MKGNLTTIIIVGFIGCLGFFGGMQYQKTQSRDGLRQFMTGGSIPARGMSGDHSIRDAGGRVIGEILNIDDESMTVKMTDGSSKIVIFSDKTAYNKTSKGSVDDLKTGDNVGVFGVANSDGSVTASDIQINPEFRVGSSSADKNN
ncbi:hypothetical protein ACFL1A_02410 [Patescibacteria group bacterium]